ncbi:MAG TPA: ATP-dependent DNA ligase [Candidatus Baltobacteraceae bacterium]|nr:ATP-dependent DNA ligase [Candidatus Baltobacteraceae bacterium]
MVRFGQTCAAIAARPGKLEKIAILSEYLASLGDADLACAARFFTGNPFAARDERSLGIGWRIIVEAAKNAWDVPDGALAAAYREHGDLGASLGPFVRPAMDLALFSETLTPAALYALFEAIASASGKSAGRKRLALCERILRACTDPVEATYVIKIMTGDLRIGLREGLIVDAIAAAFSQPAHDVRRAVMASGDAGAVACAAKHGRLAELRVAYGSPIGFMLATPIAYGSEYKDLRDADWVVEEKFDGIRAQAHKTGGSVRLFSRTLNDVTRSYPEVESALRAIPGDFMLDGEIVASRGDRVLPFRYLQARLQRKAVSGELAGDVPVAYVAFDMLADGDEFLIDEPLLVRRERLASRIVPSSSIRIASFRALAQPATGEELEERFADARAAGHEGLMLKRTDAAYHPGRRGKWWLKLKRELSTLDVVVVAVEWGHGKRAKVLSDYTFAVRGERGELLTIGKAYSGLTEAEIAKLTEWFLENRLDGVDMGYRLAVKPEIVLEVAFDIIQPSDLHESGFALRFPRIVRIRDDKPASEIDTIERVREIYREMLAREGVAR